MKIAICIPSGDDWKADFGYDLAQMLLHTCAGRTGFAIGLENIRLSVLPTARNLLVKHALQNGVTHILMLDADMRFPPDTLIRLLSARKPIVAANCVQRCFPSRATAWKDNRFVYTDDTKSGLEEVESIGTAVMLIDARVFEDIPPPAFFFEPKPDDPLTFLGEDQYFCRKAREHGHGVWIDHDLSRDVGHVGTLAYTHEMAVACRDKVPVILNSLGVNTPINPSLEKVA